MFYGDSETGQTLPQDFIFLKEQWKLNNISMFVQLPNDISSAAQQFFFPTKHGLNRALLSLSVSRAFLPELLWGYYIQAQELILQLLKLHPLIPVCCSRSLTGPNNHGKISLYWQPPSALMSTNRVSGCYHKRCHWPYNHRSMDRVSVGCSLLVWLFQACPASFPAIWSNSQTHQMTADSSVPFITWVSKMYGYGRYGYFRWPHIFCYPLFVCLFRRQLMKEWLLDAKATKNDKKHIPLFSVNESSATYQPWVCCIIKCVQMLPMALKSVPDQFLSGSFDSYTVGEVLMQTNGTQMSGLGRQGGEWLLLLLFSMKNSQSCYWMKNISMW